MNHQRESIVNCREFVVVLRGLAAANGRLYLSAMDGKVMCLGGVSLR